MNATHMLFVDFATRAEADQALANLEGMGYTSSDISVIAKEDGRTVEKDGAGEVAEDTLGGAATGGVIGGIAGLLAGIGVVPALAGILIGGPVAAALGLAGAAATTVSGAVTGAVAGGLIGALTGIGLSEEDAKYYDDAVRGGDIVIGVPVTPDTEEHVRAALEAAEGAGGAADRHITVIERTFSDR
ncbi:MAG TPA: low temperature-induced protein [Verrucomicrobiae bacterium]|nr:low temperature-induced protein [Verrucomicrobiae bacterium]